MPARIHVVGIGSPFGDDRAGWAAIDQLSSSILVSQVLADAVSFARCDSPANLLLEDYRACDALVVIDAMCSEAAPGSVCRLSAAEAGTMRSSWSSHGFDVAGALALGQTIRALPARIVLYGIELDTSSAGAEMSEPVRQALPALVNRIEAELIQLLGLDASGIKTTSNASASNSPP